jgi:hypothetical protein
LNPQAAAIGYVIHSQQKTASYLRKPSFEQFLALV